MNEDTVSKLKRSYSWKVRDQQSKGFSFELSFNEFIWAWTQSGKLHLRKAGPSGYVMTKIDHSQPYSLTNFQIIPRWQSKQDGFVKKGEKQSPAHVEARRRALTGQEKSPAHKTKISEAMKEAWTRRRAPA